MSNDAFAVLSDTDREAAENYLLNKWGITPLTGSVLRFCANDFSVQPRWLSMKHAALLELLISGTIGAYCLIRAIGVMPAAIEQAKHILLLGVERQRRIEEMLETD